MRGCSVAVLGGINQNNNVSVPIADFPKFCYSTAYFVLPRLLFTDPARIIGCFTENEYPPGPYLFALSAIYQKLQGSREQILSFQTHTGVLPNALKYCILEYPTPPPFDLNQPGAVLSPYFSAIIFRQVDADVAYFTLGQRPVGGGTTLRRVIPDGSNANLGPGSPPQLDAFLKLLNERTARL